LGEPMAKNDSARFYLKVSDWVNWRPFKCDLQGKWFWHLGNTNQFRTRFGWI